MEEPVSYTYEDFADGTAPYEYIYQLEGDKFTQSRELEKLSRVALKLGFKAFKRTYKDYVRTVREGVGKLYADGTTQFEGQELELNCGQWRADEFGVSIDGRFGEEQACDHPILPVMRLVNVDTGAEKLKIAYRKGKQWRSVIADKKTLAGNNSILNLAEVGIGVNSENSHLLVRYLHDVESLNYDSIPEKNSVSRLGWIGEEGFSPYVDNLVFDGEESFRSFFASVKPKGDFGKWLELARQIRQQGGVPARMILAASLASALVAKVDALSFFVHLWGSESGTGKTVALMLAASVWANPEMGQYIHTFNGTSVSLELSAGFVNSLPLILDEFQMLRDKKNFEQNVYLLAEGVGRGRGARTGGIQRLQTWRNCILTSGEMPITNFMTGAGAFNRIVEIECTEKLFYDPLAVLAVIQRNYGHAGKEFVSRLQEENNVRRAQTLYAAYMHKMTESDTTDKQAMAGAILLTADSLATEWIFRDNQALQTGEILEYLQTKSEVDMGERAYNYICEYVMTNANRFRPDVDIGEVWGKLEGNQAYIIRSVFGRICEEGGYSARALLSWMVRRGIVEPSINSKSGKKEPTRIVKIGGMPVRHVVMRMPIDNDCEDDLDF